MSYAIRNPVLSKAEGTHHVSRFAFLLLLLLISTSAARSDTALPLVRGEELVFTGQDFADGVLQGMVVAAGYSSRSEAEGLTLSGGESGTYTSPPIAAPLPFTDVGPQWLIDLPAGAGYTLELRTGPDGNTWDDWVEVEGELDWVRPETNEWMGDLVAVPKPIRLHRYVQYRWYFTAAPDGQSPLLRRLRLAFIDASMAPEIQAPPPQPTPIAGGQSLDAYPKPSVVSRTNWGCPDEQGSPNWPPEYVPVTHVIVHHTVSDTSVYAIWYYHAITRDWGDIGYNYLVDTNGILYEGRAGGDDVIGGHAYPCNPGSLGVSFIGNYCSNPVPQVMLDNMAELLAWKADQRGIDPHGWGWLRPSNYPDYPERWLPRIMGHRDVAQTACPGDVLYAHLPMLRDEVASLLDTSAYTFVDDLDAGAEFYGPTGNWHHGPDGCGYDGHAYWTFSVDTGPKVNWATWRPNLPQAGSYRVYAYVPYCINGYADSSGVYYRIHHTGGDTTVAVSQAAAAGGWVELGLFDFAAGTSGYVSLDDIADDKNKTIWFDTIKWFWEGAGGGGTLPPNNTHPADNSWRTSRNVAFQWSSSLTSGVDHYWLRIATNPDLIGPIHSASVDYAGADYWYTFGADYPQLYWGVQAHGPDGYSPPSGPWQLGVDTVIPASGVDNVFVYPDEHYSVHWSGQDATSGVATFDIQRRQGISGTWTTWLAETTTFGVTFSPAVSDTFWFRSRATDAAGNLGEFDDGQMNTADAILLDKQMWFPLIYRVWPPEP